MLFHKILLKASFESFLHVVSTSGLALWGASASQIIAEIFSTGLGENSFACLLDHSPIILMLLSDIFLFYFFFPHIFSFITQFSPLSLQDLSRWKSRRRSTNSDLHRKLEEREQIELICGGGTSAVRTAQLIGVPEERSFIL